MSFDRLTGNARSRILLANLHNTVHSGLVDPSLIESAVKDLHSRLSTLVNRPRHETILKTFGDVLHADHPDYKFAANELPGLGERIALVANFDKVSPIIRNMARWLRPTEPADAQKLKVALSDAPTTAALREAVEVLNRQRDSTQLPLTNVNLLLWAAPLSAIEHVLADPGLSAIARATRLRDMLGLIHLDPPPTSVNRHLFLFRSERTLGELRSLPLRYAVARPTTFDGFDNRRFCQRPLSGRRPGWGNTVDLAASTCGIGLPEVVLTPMLIAHFTCEYLGEIDGSRFSSDDHYFDMLAPSPPDAAAMAADLDSLAAAP